MVQAGEQKSMDKELFAKNNAPNAASVQETGVATDMEVCEVLKRYVSNDIEGALGIINSYYASRVSDTNRTKTNYEKLEDYLSDNNVHIYEYTVTSAEGNRSVGSTDVNMNSVIIAYHSSTNRWSVTGGGYWSSTTYLNDAPAPNLIIGALNVGGMDAIGVALTNTSGTIPSLLSSSGYAHDGHGHNISMTNPSTSNSAHGVAFQFQDQIYFSDDNIDDVCYLGYGFSAQAIYNSSFAQYHGRARSYYAHTWSNCSINSIGISNSGISVTLSNSNYGWEIYNNSDTVF